MHIGQSVLDDRFPGQFYASGVAHSRAVPPHLSGIVHFAGAPLFPGATLNSSIPEDSVPAMDCIGISGGRNKTPTAWEEPGAHPRPLRTVRALRLLECRQLCTLL